MVLVIAPAGRCEERTTSRRDGEVEGRRKADDAYRRMFCHYAAGRGT